MARVNHQPGDTMTWTNGTGSAVASGAPVPIGRIMGVALVDIANGASGAVATEGVFNLPKASGDTFTQGEAVIWDVSGGNFVDSGDTPATGDVSVCCIAWEAAGSAATTAMIKINVGIGTVA